MPPDWATEAKMMYFGGYSHAEIADHVGVSKQRVHQVLTGKKQMPKEQRRPYRRWLKMRETAREFAGEKCISIEQAYIECGVDQSWKSTWAEMKSGTSDFYSWLNR